MPTPVEVPPPSEGNAFVALGVPDDLAGLLEAGGVTEPFPIQTATLPDSLAGRDVLGQGRTGSGKTLAFALPLVTRLAADPQRRVAGRPRALVLVPTRELANQVAAVIEPLARQCRLGVVTVFGGVGHGPQRSALRAGVEIVVACPGRLLDHMGEGTVSLDSIEITVLDEADHMADQGFLPMVKRILDATPEVGQRMLFSATLAGGVDVIVNRYLEDPVSHSAGVEAPVLLDHHVHVIDEGVRLETLARLCNDGRVVVFCRTKHRAKQLTKKLAAVGVGAVEMHGNLSQNARERNLSDFADGTASVLVATDIAARGIHVDEVALVVHADPPIEHKAYTHRSGRTARAGAAGTVITLSSHEQMREVAGLLRQAGVTATWHGAPEPQVTGRGGGSARPSSGRGGGGGAPRGRSSAAPRNSSGGAGSSRGGARGGSSRGGSSGSGSSHRGSR